MGKHQISKYFIQLVSGNLPGNIISYTYLNMFLLLAQATNICSPPSLNSDHQTILSFFIQLRPSNYSFFFYSTQTNKWFFLFLFNSDHQMILSFFIQLRPSNDSFFFYSTQTIKLFFHFLFNSDHQTILSFFIQLRPSKNYTYKVTKSFLKENKCMWG